MAYNINVALRVSGVEGLQRAQQQIRSSLGGVAVRVKVEIDPGSLRDLANLNRALSGVGKSLEQLQAKATAFSAAVSGAGAAAAQASRGVASLNSASSAAVASLQNVSRAAGDEATFLERLGGLAGLAAKRFVAFTVGAGAIVALTRGLREGFSAAFEFERQMLKLNQVSSDSVSRVGEVRQEIGRLATAYGVSSQELANAAVVLKQAGLSFQQVKSTLETLALAATAPNFGSMTESAEGAIAAMQQFKLDAAGVREAIGAMNQVAADFAVEGRDLVQVLQRTGGVAAQTGTSLNQLLGLFTSVRATTRESAETIATGLRTIFSRLQQNATVSALRDLGINLRYTRQEAEALRDVGLTNQFVGGYEAVRRLNEGLAGLRRTDPRFAAVVEELGGQRQVSRVIPLIQEFRTAQQAVNAAQVGAVSLTIAQEKGQDTLVKKTDQLTQSFLELFRTVENSSGFQSFAKGAVDLANALLKVTEYLKPLLPMFATLATIKLFTGLGSVTGFASNLASQFSGATRTRPFARGGVVPGVGDTDSVPATLTPGEFVIRKQAAREIGYDRLREMNKAGRVGMAGGGYTPRVLSAEQYFGLRPNEIPKEHLSEFDLRGRQIARSFGRASNLDLTSTYDSSVGFASRFAGYDKKNEFGYNGYAQNFSPSSRIGINPQLFYSYVSSLVSPGYVVNNDAKLSHTIGHELGHAIDFFVTPAGRGKATKRLVSQYRKLVENRDLPKDYKDFLLDDGEIFGDAIGLGLSGYSSFQFAYATPRVQTKELVDLAKLARGPAFDEIRKLLGPYNLARGYTSGGLAVYPEGMRADPDELFRQLEAIYGMTGSRRYGHAKGLLRAALTPDVLSRIPAGSQLLGSGLVGTALREPAGDVLRLQSVLGNRLGRRLRPDLGREYFSTRRPNIKGVLQPIARELVGSRENAVLVEKLPFAPPADMTEAEFENVAARMQALMASQGYQLKDAHAGNIGWHKGRYVVIDPGTLSRLPYKYDGPAVPSVGPAPTRVEPQPEDVPTNVIRRVRRAGGGITPDADHPLRPENSDFVSLVLSRAGEGKPGLFTEHTEVPVGAFSVNGVRVVYRGPDGMPVAAAVLVDDGKGFAVKDYATDKSRGLLAARAAIEVGKVIVSFGATRPAGTISPSANKLLSSYLSGTRKMAGGGHVDSVPALLTPGEFVLNRDAVASIGVGTLEAMNATGKVRGYNKGGYVHANAGKYIDRFRAKNKPLSAADVDARASQVEPTPKPAPPPAETAAQEAARNREMVERLQREEEAAGKAEASQSLPNLSPGQNSRLEANLAKVLRQARRFSSRTAKGAVDKDTAQSIAQEVLARVVAQGEGENPGYIYTAVRNRLVDELKKVVARSEKARSQAVGDRDFTPEQAASGAASVQLPREGRGLNSYNELYARAQFLAEKLGEVAPSKRKGGSKAEIEAYVDEASARFAALGPAATSAAGVDIPKNYVPPSQAFIIAMAAQRAVSPVGRNVLKELASGGRLAGQVGFDILASGAGAAAGPAGVDIPRSFVPPPQPVTLAGGGGGRPPVVTPVAAGGDAGDGDRRVVPYNGDRRVVPYQSEIVPYDPLRASAGGGNALPGTDYIDAEFVVRGESESLRGPRRPRRRVYQLADENDEIRIRAEQKYQERAARRRRRAASGLSGGDAGTYGLLDEAEYSGGRVDATATPRPRTVAAGREPIDVLTYVDSLRGPPGPFYGDNTQALVRQQLQGVDASILFGRRAEDGSRLEFGANALKAIDARGGEARLSRGTQVDVADAADKQAYAELVRGIRRQLRSIDGNISAVEANKKAHELAADAIRANAKLIQDSRGRAVGLASLAEENLNRGLPARGRLSLFDTAREGAGNAFSYLGSLNDRFSQTRAGRVAGGLGSNIGLQLGVPYLAAGVGALGGTAELAAAQGGAPNTFRAAKGLEGGLQGLAIGATTGFAVGGPLGAAVGAVAGAAIGFASAFNDAAKEINNAKIGAALTVFGDRLQSIAQFGALASPESFSTGLAQIRAARRENTERNDRESRYFFGLGPRSESAFAARQAASDRRDYSQFLGPSIQALQRQMADIVRRDPGLNERQTFDQVFNGTNGQFNRELLRIIADTRGLSPAQAEDEQRRAVSDTFRQARAELASATGRRGEDRASSSLARLVLSLQSAADSVLDLQRSTRALSDLFDGTVSSSRVDIRAEAITQLGRPDRGALVPLGVVGAVGGEGGQALLRLGRVAERASAALPSALSQAASLNPTTGEDFVTKVTSLLRDNLGADDEALTAINTVARALNEASRGERGPESLLREVSIDTTKFSERLLAALVDPLKQAGQNAAKLIEQNANQYADGLAQLRQRVAATRDAFDRVAQLRVQSVRAAAEFAAENSGQRSDPLRNVSLAQLQAGVVARQESLTGERGGEAFDPAFIGRELQKANAEVLRLTGEQQRVFQDPVSGGAGRAFQEVTQQLANMKGRAADLTAALQSLTAAAKNAAIEEKLRPIRADEQSRLNLAERYYTSDRQGRAEISRGLLLANAANNAGTLDRFAPQAQAIIVQTLRGLGQTKLSGFQGAPVASDLLERLYKNSAGGIFGLDAKSSQEKGDLQKQYLDNLDKAVTAQAELAKNAKSLQEQFFTQLNASQDQFFSRLQANLLSDKLTDQIVKAGDAQKVLAQAAGIQSQAGLLASAGITSQEQLNRLRENGTVSAFGRDLRARDSLAEAALQARAAASRVDFGATLVPPDTLTRAERLENLLQNQVKSLNSQQREKVAALVSDTLKLSNDPKKINEGVRNAIRKVVSDQPGSELAEANKKLASSRQAAVNAGLNPEVLAAQYRTNAGAFEAAVNAFDGKNASLDTVNQSVATARQNFDSLNQSIAQLRQTIQSLQGQQQPASVPAAAQQPAAPLNQNEQALQNLRDYQARLRAGQFASGGVVGAHPGSPSGTDTVPAWLTPGEFVVRASAAQIHMPLLRAINSGGQSRSGYFASGGVVSGGPGVSPEVARAFEMFGAGAAAFRSGVEAFGSAAQSLARGLAGFQAASSELAAALDRFPSSLQISGTQRVEVSISGGDGLAKLQSSLKDIVDARVSAALQDFFKRQMPEAQIAVT